MVTSLLNQSKVIIWPMKDGDAKRKYELGPIITMSCHPWDSNAKVRPSGTQWSEDLFHGKQPKLHSISTFDLSELTVPPFVEPSQTKEPTIPGPIPYSKPHEDVPTSEPIPDVAPTQSMEEPFGKSQIYFFSSPCLQTSPDCPTPPHSVITINNAPVRSPSYSPENPTASSPHSHDEARQEFTNLPLTLMIPKAIFHKSINQILLENY
ncbi:hypothetical protein O181_071609 [Austropuccinia psidii MF-1]|uniref:Uncharacterized protein n=1 Tax=Austropuccinia psidii MF-1 TaxID=1389203 RepID=A0A9Q3IAN6_9BASI|nr:hypothetical protein [Austropuccinia psidii MF-1]